jgi:hypothetical protein
LRVCAVLRSPSVHCMRSSSWGCTRGAIACQISRSNVTLHTWQPPPASSPCRIISAAWAAAAFTRPLSSQDARRHCCARLRAYRSRHHQLQSQPYQLQRCSQQHSLPQRSLHSSQRACSEVQTSESQAPAAAPAGAIVVFQVQGCVAPTPHDATPSQVSISKTRHQQDEAFAEHERRRRRCICIRERRRHRDCEYCCSNNSATLSVLVCVWVPSKVAGPTAAAGVGLG